MFYNDKQVEFFDKDVFHFTDFMKTKNFQDMEELGKTVMSCTHLQTSRNTL